MKGEQGMVNYIEKSAIVAEIEKLIYEIYAGRTFDSLSSEQQTALQYLNRIMSFIDDLEVKQLNLEKELEHYIDEHKSELRGYFDIRRIARHFFNFGLNFALEDHQQTKELLKMLLEAIDYSFAQTDGTYDLTLTYPVIDKVKCIKQKLRENI